MYSAVRAVMERLVSALIAASLVVQPVLAQDTTPPAVAKPAASSEERDERGLWMATDEAERELKRSPLVMHDPALNAYVRSVLCRTVGEQKCANVRLYLVRTPDFNASMMPNGVMQVWSGLLLRLRNEAQLAAVLGHEYTHYEKRHTLQWLREARSRSNAGVWLSMLTGGLLAALLTMPGLFEHSREMEQEADMGGLTYIVNAGYDTREAAKTWESLRAEMDATAAARKMKSRKDKDRGLFASHPPTAERVKYLAEAAIKDPGTPGGIGADSYAAAMARFWPLFVEDQLKNNDFGATEYLVTSIARDGWSDWLYYARGELYRRRAGAGDLEKAVGFFTDGITAMGATPELWRGRGLALLKLGQTDSAKQDLKEYLKRAPDAPDKAMIAMMAGG